MDRLRDNLHRVRDRIERACQRSGRNPTDVRLVAVTKTVSIDTAAELLDLGVTDLAESRPQELWNKAEALPHASWHLIGHLQRNKIERTLPLVHMLHSVDSLRLLDALEADCARRQCRLPILLEINAGREPNKHGFAPEDLALALDHVQRLHWVEPLGLMTMAALEEDPLLCRPTFALARELRDRMRQILPQAGELSMGMSNDFEIAIEEGATLIRLGSILFEGVSALRH